MIVELNDKAFAKAKDGDVFVIEEKNGKKYAAPVSKQMFLNELDKRIESVELKALDLEKRFNLLDHNVNDKVVKIAKLVGGNNNEEKL